MRGNRTSLPGSCLLLVLLTVACSAARGYAADLYISPGDSVTNAMAAASPGDTVHLNAGTYYENVQINTSGTSSAWISIVANGSVVIDAGGAGKALRIAANYIVIDGLECTNYLEGINMRTGHIKILNCNFHGGTSTTSLVAGSNGLTVNFDTALDDIDIENSNFYFNDGAGADFGCNNTTDVLTNLTLVNCKFYSNNAANSETGAVGIGHQGTKANISVIRCQAYDNLCSGFDMDAPIYMDGCIAHDNDRNGGPNWGVGIKVWGHTGNPPVYGQVTLFNCLAYNNTEETTGGGGINIGGTNSLVANCLVSGNNSYAGLIICSGASVSIKNTIFYAEHYAISSDSDVSGLNFDASNIIYNCINTGPIPVAALVAAKSFDPQFVNPTDNDSPPWGDFHLQSTSPAIDAGVVITTLTDDADGNPRPSGSGFDIGPYEYQQTTASSPVITSAPTFSPDPAIAGQPVTFVAAASDAAGDPLTYTWDFGDGGSGAGTTPTYVYAAAGTYTATVSVSDGHSAPVSASVTVIVNAPPPPPPPPAVPVITSPTSASGTAGTAFTYTITATNMPTAFSASGLPAGLGLDANTGIISGTSTDVGTFTIVLGAGNDAGTGTATLTLTIAAPPVNKTMHVTAIAMSLSTTRRGKAASAIVHVKDAKGRAIKGAVVSGTWSGLTSANVSGLSNTSGAVKFTSARIKTSTLNVFTFTVTNITLTGYIYAPGQNAVSTATINTQGIRQ